MMFWLAMLAVASALPLVMLGCGAYFSKSFPKKINSFFGYRTAMSMKNEDTWIFAHNYFGSLWFIFGVILLPLSVVSMFFVLGKDSSFILTLIYVIEIIQVVFLLVPIIFTERALRRTFDKNGNRL